MAFLVENIQGAALIYSHDIESLAHICGSHIEESWSNDIETLEENLKGFRPITTPVPTLNVRWEGPKQSITAFPIERVPARHKLRPRPLKARSESRAPGHAAEEWTPNGSASGTTQTTGIG